MNLYLVNIQDTQSTGVYGETFHIQAASARVALEKSYKKFERRYPDCGPMTLRKLELVEESW